MPGIEQPQGARFQAFFLSWQELEVRLINGDDQDDEQQHEDEKGHQAIAFAAGILDF